MCCRFFDTDIQFSKAAAAAAIFFGYVDPQKPCIPQFSPQRIRLLAFVYDILKILTPEFANEFADAIAQIAVMFRRIA